MDEKETEKEFAKEHRDYAHCLLQYSDDRINKLSDSLANKLLQTATIIFAFSTAFLGKLAINELWVKIVFIIGLILLLISIVFGIVHETVRIKFWEKWANKRNRIFETFNKAREGRMPYKEALTRYEEIIVKIGLNKSSDWAYTIQAILLILGTINILISSSVYLLN